MKPPRGKSTRFTPRSYSPFRCHHRPQAVGHALCHPLTRFDVLRRPIGHHPGDEHQNHRRHRLGHNRPGRSPLAPRQEQICCLQSRCDEQYEQKPDNFRTAFPNRRPDILLVPGPEAPSGPQGVEAPGPPPPPRLSRPGAGSWASPRSLGRSKAPARASVTPGPSFFRSGTGISARVSFLNSKPGALGLRAVGQQAVSLC